MRLTHFRNGETFVASLLLSALLLALTPTAMKTAGHTRPAPPKQDVKKTFTQLPAFFEENVGQFAGRAKFVSRGAGHTLQLGVDGITLALKRGGGKEGSGDTSRRTASEENARGRRAPEPFSQHVRMQFVGANPRAEMAGEGVLKGRVNYFVGRDASKWRAGLKMFSGVRYRDLYRGVDLVFHGGSDGGRLEYDFVLAPGADYKTLRLRFEGVDRLSLGKGGELLLHTKAGTISQSAPVIYQETNGARRTIEGGYVLRGRREVGFRVGEYDPARRLVIDPVLVYSTYFFSSADMAVDSAGAVYVVGTAENILNELPTTPGAFQTTRRGLTDAFVAKLNPAGTALDYLTYLGGAGLGGIDGFGDRGNGIAVDAAGNAYVTGITETTDFPVTPGAFQPASGGAFDGFVAKLNANGSALLYSSYLGGLSSEWSRSIALDAAGSAYVAGGTNSTNFPVKNALQPARKGGEDFFLTKVAPDGRSLEYSTYLGGTEFDSGFEARVAVDAAGAAYLTGSSFSRDYPTTAGAFQTTPTLSDGFFYGDAVVSKVAPGGASLVYSTYLGGTRGDYAYGVALDAEGQVHVVGLTDSEDFPTQNALHPTARDPRGNGFLTKLNAAGTGLVYSTYLSGTPTDLCGPIFINVPVFCGGEYATAVTTDAAGNAYVTGKTISADFPTPADSLQSSRRDPSDAYVIKFNPAGQALYATRFGGSNYDEGGDIDVPSGGGLVYLLGFTSSDDLPTVNPYRDMQAPGFDFVYGSFLAKLSETTPPGQTSRVHFDAATYSVGEADRFVQVGVTRAGDLSGEVSVDYSTSSEGAASERSDYTTARGTLRFAPGETLKTFNVTVNDDRTVEGDESLTLLLHNLRGAGLLDAPASAQLTIIDNDEHPSPTNPIDDTQFFVRQHYVDFLNREPDPDGLAFWTGEIDRCGADTQCREAKRIDVSAAFFLSIEFQEIGFLVERFYMLAFEVRVPYRGFVREAGALGDGVVVGQGDWQARLAANRRAYAEEFTTRQTFREEFPVSLTAAQYVERLNARASGALSTSEFAALVAGLEAGTETRGSVLLKVADDADFRRREFAPAFVLMQYLGYLRRDPDEGGYQFWLDKLNRFGGDFRRAEMVKAFLSSDEYRRRFLEPQKETTFGTPFTLGYGETVVVQPDKLRVKLTDYSPDRRCPRNVQCVNVGSISILLEAAKPNGEATHLVLSIPGLVPRPHPTNPSVSALGYTFRLLQADPEPPYPTPVPPFQATLQVDKP